MFKSFFLIWIGVVFSFLNSPIVAHPEDPLKSEPYLSNPYKECIKKNKQTYDNILSCSNFADERNGNDMNMEFKRQITLISSDPQKRKINYEMKKDFEKSQEAFEKWLSLECKNQKKWIYKKFSEEFCSQYLKRFRSFQLSTYLRFPQNLILDHNSN